MGWGSYLTKRIVSILPVLVAVSLITFSLIYVTGADPVRMMLGHEASPTAVAKVRAIYNLDQPIYMQYLIWIFKIMQGDLGISIWTSESVSKMILDRLPTTLSLAIVAMIFSLAVSLPAGVLSGLKRRSLASNVTSVLTLMGISIPNFFLAIILILILGLYLRLVPTTGGILLPAISLGVPYAAVVTRQLRSSMLEVSSKDFVTVLRAKGLSESKVLLHVVKNSLIPVITVSAIQLAYLLGGAIIIESIFALPGVGTLLIRAVSQRDIPVVQGVVLFITMMYILGSLLADILYSVVDPRIRYD